MCLCLNVAFVLLFTCPFVRMNFHSWCGIQFLLYNGSLLVGFFAISLWLATAVPPAPSAPAACQCQFSFPAINHVWHCQCNLKDKKLSCCVLLGGTFTQHAKSKASNEEKIHLASIFNNYSAVQDHNSLLWKKEPYSPWEAKDSLIFSIGWQQIVLSPGQPNPMGLYWFTQ